MLLYAVAGVLPLSNATFAGNTSDFGIPLVDKHGKAAGILNVTLSQSGGNNRFSKLLIHCYPALFCSIQSLSTSLSACLDGMSASASLYTTRQRSVGNDAVLPADTNIGGEGISPISDESAFASTGTGTGIGRNDDAETDNGYGMTGINADTKAGRGGLTGGLKNAMHHGSEDTVKTTSADGGLPQGSDYAAGVSRGL